MPTPAGWCSRHLWHGGWCCTVSGVTHAHCQPTCNHLKAKLWVGAAALVILLPLFVMADPGEGAVKAVIILQNIVLGGFLAMLFWIFR